MSILKTGFHRRLALPRRFVRACRYQRSDAGLDVLEQFCEIGFCQRAAAHDEGLDQSKATPFSREAMENKSGH